MVYHPGGSLPEKINSPADLKAMYRLLDCEEVSHAAILAAHQKHLRDTVFPRPDGYTLVIHDSTELEYTKRRSLNRRGLIAHHSLVVCPESRMALGLANQILHRRVEVPEGETDSARHKRSSRESRLWLAGTAGLPARRSVVDVCDRGADTLEFLQHEQASGRTFVIRSSQNRNCYAGAGAVTRLSRVKLHAHARSLPALGTWQLEVSGKTEFKSKNRNGKKEEVTRRQRTATVAVSTGYIQLPLSKAKVPATTGMWVVRVWELSPPAGEEPLEWFLLTNHPVSGFEEAWQVTTWYECRWVVEEFHKCQKTGMNIESFQFTSSARLEPAIALTSIVALTLLQLRDASRRQESQDRPASEFLDPDYIEILSLWRHGQPRPDWTVREFVLAMARLAGHQNRRGDHPPGWQKLWKGWTELQAMITGARIARQIKKRCG
jgi:hypothetical protein